MTLELAYMSLSYLLYSPIKSVNCIRQFKALPTRRVIRQGTNTILYTPAYQETSSPAVRRKEVHSRLLLSLSFSLSRYDTIRCSGECRS